MVRNILLHHGPVKKADAELAKSGKIMRRLIPVYLISAEWKEVMTYLFLLLYGLWDKSFCIKISLVVRDYRNSKKKITLSECLYYVSTTLDF